ncbi:RagB/SusD family nutrient uptake outer membrane protein [Pedobacter fastidiosus]|uniref:RagB/SusD family nutrient uptake outer membrane protein n=1 Tax=Pedobacter fastidiosus TaxID=2765361 RepID=A0ABR7KVB7_9SPHI|nr:RagB/SusD family nutrient uptake outer membrane protein [Pedobacter fastidiosus]MBC6112053.1 RagB/SusD family nutrient uptake outer membrane protein [Pedobacter fastidiosus]
MKKYFKYIALICLTISVTSCKKGFLEESSQDLVRPTTTAALNQLMTGEAYQLSSTMHDYIELLSDDVQSDYNSNAIVVAGLNKYSSVFTWRKDMLDRLIENAASTPNAWYNYYAKIKGCNVVLDYVGQVSGNESEKQNLRGQALALRSFYYFMMVNLFGKPYLGTTVSPETDLGVPLILTAEVTDAPIKRSTVKEVYTQIVNDLNTAIPLLDTNGAGNSIYKLNGTAARLLLSRINLYMGNWDATIKNATEVLQKKSTLKQYNEVLSSVLTYPVSSAITSPEVIWGYGFYAELGNMPFGAQSVTRASYSFSDNLSSSFESSDLRLKFTLLNIAYINGSSLVTYKGRSGKFVNTSASNSMAFRTAEAYLNRAEAYIQKAIAGDQSAVTKALEDINYLRSFRIATASYAPITITDPQALYTFYKAERRRELCAEGHRWFDLRRWGMPSIQHSLQLTAGAPTIETLQQNDNRYTLGIPTEALNRNPNLIQNP